MIWREVYQEKIMKAASRWNVSIIFIFSFAIFTYGQIIAKADIDEMQKRIEALEAEVKLLSQKLVRIKSAVPETASVSSEERKDVPSQPSPEKKLRRRSPKLELRPKKILALISATRVLHRTARSTSMLFTTLMAQTTQTYRYLPRQA